MSIQIQCSSCSHKLRVPESYAGKNGKCPKCSAQIKIPKAGTPALPTNSATTDTELPPIVAATPAVSAPMAVAGKSNPYQTSAPKADKSLSTSARLTLRRIDVMSAGKTLGALYAILGLIVGVVMGVLIAIGAVAGGTSGAGSAEMLGAGIGGAIAVMFFTPVFYGILGFAGGLLMGFSYNLAAGVSGGISFET